MGASTLLADQVSAQDAFAHYLTARNAEYNGDIQMAAEYFSRSLDADPENTHILQESIWPFVQAGDFGAAVEASKWIAEAGLQSGPAEVVLFVDDFLKGNYEESASHYEHAFRNLDQSIYGIGPGWLNLAQGDVEAAVEEFDKVSEVELLRPYAEFHKSLALAVAGDFESAGIILDEIDPYPNEIRYQALFADAQIRAQLEDIEGAINALPLVRRARRDPGVEMVGIARDKLLNGEQVDFEFVTEPQHGVAELFAMIARAQRDNGNQFDAVTYSRLASSLDPSNLVLQISTANMLEDYGNLELARDIYAAVPADHGLYPTAAIGNAKAAYNLGDSDGAIALLRELSETHGEYPWVQVELGNLLRYERRFEEAVEAYDAAISSMAGTPTSDWTVHYFRAICHFELDRWADARSDFEIADELSGGNAVVLNFLGYSLADRGEELDRAEDLIRRAVDQNPTSGAFVDSLGWVLYRKGRFHEAVEQLELATKLLPYDPIVVDHLGDAYWQVGRIREAKFLWNRALGFEPSERDEKRILRKLEVGLDKVLEEELSSN